MIKIGYLAAMWVNVVFKMSRDLKSLIIKDDGKGFSNDGTSDGNGLKNLSYRSGQIGYRVEIISSPGKGTVVKIEKNRRAF